MERSLKERSEMKSMAKEGKRKWKFLFQRKISVRRYVAYGLIKEENVTPEKWKGKNVVRKEKEAGKRVLKRRKWQKNEEKKWNKQNEQLLGMSKCKRGVGWKGTRQNVIEKEKLQR